MGKRKERRGEERSEGTLGWNFSMRMRFIRSVMLFAGESAAVKVDG